MVPLSSAEDHPQRTDLFRCEAGLISLRVKLALYPSQSMNDVEAKKKKKKKKKRH
eukprot:NODE_4319_length_1906_cov_5.588533.p13 GENE.NODE_4319_length_1906_cov_5.588533~~NODE_4319_length_1906_cov_5.588533.p13  ORF type:complete len:55 (+),score=22.84 NODE_4319_length_1906_cov_5.588533:1659-1823(+)